MRFLTVAFCALLLAVPASAGKGKKHPHDAITVTLAGNQATFIIHLDAQLAPQLAYSLWVANICTDDTATVVSAEYHPVVWAGDADLQPIDGTAGPFTTAGASCTGFTWMFPDAWTPIDSVTYTP